MRTASLTVVLAALPWALCLPSVANNGRDISSSNARSVKRVEVDSKVNLRAMAARDDTATPVERGLDKTLFSRAAASAFPGSAQFQSATERWNVYGAPTFVESITVSNENDVAQAVKFANANNLPFLATSTRHGYGITYAQLKNGLAIDLSQLNNVSVSKCDQTVTVGPGATNGDVLAPVDAAGFELPTGSCSCVSQIGATLGAGVGRWSGVYGLLIDGLVSVRLVTASGSIVTASTTQNSDLFWGIRGAGANFGIVVSATYKLRKPINNGNAFSTDVMFPLSQKTDFFNLIDSLKNSQPGELAITAGLIFDATSGQPLIVSNWLYHGTQAAAQKYVAPLLALKPITSTSNVVRWTDVTKTAVFGSDPQVCQSGAIHSIFTNNVKNLNVSTFEASFDALAQFYNKFPEGRGSLILLEIFPNQAVLQTPSSATSYPWRQTRANVMFQMSWTTNGSPTETAANALGQALRAASAATGGFGDLAVYVNYAHGDEKVEQIYSKANLPRLAALKKQWDPKNVFKFNNALPQKYP